ncbi:torsin-1A-like [Acanthaster planci]|uniref:Torsin-1A-like n=1 Tax=Acanthaster planci TaxID=133434 RepID=A0A8B8A3L8_ACAPL|nr:torsin-1A-like [Acanthaster planci]
MAFVGKLMCFLSICAVFIVAHMVYFFPKWTRECCEVDFGWIHLTNTSGLQEALRMQVFGQHLVTDHVAGAVGAHLTNKDPNKPLVLSFHGSTGTGKNFIARIIAETIYKEGMNSRFVHHFSANKHFPHKRKLEQYQDQLRNEVESAVKSCSRSLFIFDEVEDMPEGLLDSIRTILDYNIHVDGVDYRKTIFIFLSNIAAREIIAKTANLLASRSRREITLKEMEQVIEVTANKASGGFHQSRLIINNVVSHYFPFLPLEKSHLRKCVQVELQKRGPWLHLREELSIRSYPTCSSPRRFTLEDVQTENNTPK